MPIFSPISDADTRENDRIDVSIILPCLNEAATLETCLTGAREALETLEARHGLKGEIVLADNGSTDASREIATAAGARVLDIPERGYGAALIGGFIGARGRYLVMGDADSTYDFRECVPMVEALMKGADICMGSRFRGRILPGAMPWKNRYIGNPILSGILRLLFRTRVSDAHCGLRALTKESFNRLGLTSTGMEFASEMVLKAALLRFRIDEVPVTLSPDPKERTPHLRPWRDGWRHLRYMLMLSPTWLFLVPALLLGLVGTTIFVALLSHPQAEIIEIAGMHFGNHWMILAGATMSAAYQTLLFGGAAYIYGVRQGYRRPRPLMSRILNVLRLEHMLIASLVLVACGALYFGSVIWSWSKTEFTSLDAMRETVGAATFGLLSLQTFFGGFLISIIAGNEARFGTSRHSRTDERGS